MADPHVLALDLARKTGWAVAPFSSPPASLPLEDDSIRVAPLSGARTFGDSGDERIAIWQNCRKFVAQTIREFDVRLVVYEAPPAPRPVMRNGRPMLLTTLHTLRLLYGLHCCVETTCHGLGVDCREVNTGTIKKHATGKGNAKKEQMIEAATAMGWSPKTADEADALWLLDYTLHILRKRKVSA